MRTITTWFGLQRDEGPADVIVIGCPFDEPASRQHGAACGPDAIRRWSRTSEAVAEDGQSVRLRVRDLGDAEAGTADRVARWEAIEQLAEQGGKRHPAAFQLGLGGDHSVTPPLVGAVRKRHPDLAFVMVDAHPDAFMSYDGEDDTHASVLPLLWDRVGIEPATTAVLGVRSYAHEEIETLGRAGVVINAREWERVGSEVVVERLGVTIGNRPVYLSLDLDGIDPAHAPGVAYPVAGGPSARAVLRLLDGLWRHFDVVAMDVVELTPRLDTASEITAALAGHVCLQTLGHVADALSTSRSTSPRSHA